MAERLQTMLTEMDLPKQRDLFKDSMRLIRSPTFYSTKPRDLSKDSMNPDLLRRAIR